MKRFSGYLLLLAGVLAGAARWLDLVNFTSLTTGFCTVGSVWIRYGVLAALLAAAALYSPLVPRQAAARRNGGAGAMALLGGAAFAAVGGLSLLTWVQCLQAKLGGTAYPMLSAMGDRLRYLAGEGTLTGLLFVMLEFICAWWLVMMGLGWFDGRTARPTAELYAGIVGSFLFYALVLRRFMANSSSFYRIIPTTAIFTALAALLFAAALLRALFFPESENGRAVYRTGMWAFYLCFCCELPQAVCQWMAGGTELSELALSAALCCVGALGGVCALGCLGPQENTASIRESTVL